MTKEEAATRLFMAITNNELFAKMEQAGACIGDLTFIEALVKAIKVLSGKEDEVAVDSETGLVSCGCGGNPVTRKLKCSTGEDVWCVICPYCHVGTAECFNPLAAKNDWNRALRYEGEENEQERVN